MAQVDVDALLEQAYLLDTDPRYFNQDEGSFEFAGETIHFKRTETGYLLCVVGVIHEICLL